MSQSTDKWLWFGFGANVGTITLTVAYFLVGRVAMWIMGIYVGFTVYKLFIKYMGKQQAPSVNYAFVVSADHSSDSDLESNLQGTVTEPYKGDLWGEITD